VSLLFNLAVDSRFDGRPAGESLFAALGRLNDRLDDSRRAKTRVRRAFPAKQHYYAHARPTRKSRVTSERELSARAALHPDNAFRMNGLLCDVIAVVSVVHLTCAGGGGGYKFFPNLPAVSVRADRQRPIAFIDLTFVCAGRIPYRPQSGVAVRPADQQSDAVQLLREQDDREHVGPEREHVRRHADRRFV